MNVTSLFAILLILSILKSHKTIAVCSPKRKEFNLTFSNKSLSGPVFGSFVAMGEASCQYTCHSHDNCDMYNFNTETGRCKLLDARSSVFKVRYKKNWIIGAQKCKTSPCKNGGTCYHANNDVARCLCTCDWMGELCDVPNTAFWNVLSFPGRSISDFISYVDPFNTSLTALTVSMWVQIQAEQRYILRSTVSFATSAKSNAILCQLEDFKKTFITINQYERVFDDAGQAVADTDWHHVSFTWESISGTLILYIDGIKRGEKNKLATSQTIQTAGGALVLGQDQDSYLGGYDTKQAFKGYITSINIWNRVLTAYEVSVLARTCPTVEGNIIQWSQLLSLPKSGSVQVVCSEMCTS